MSCPDEIRTLPSRPKRHAQATLMLTARYLSSALASTARRAMRIAGLLLLLLSVLVGMATHTLRDYLGGVFCSDECATTSARNRIRF